MTDDELKGLFDAVRGDLSSLRQDNVALREDFSALREDFSTLRQDNVALREDFSSLRKESAVAHAETRHRVEAVVVQMDSKIEAAHAETRRHAEILAEEIRSKLELSVELIHSVDESSQRRDHDLRHSLDLSAAETQAMVKFSYAELGRRVSTLEQSVANLTARVERLESSN